MIDINRNPPLNNQGYYKRMNELESKVQQLQQALGLIATQTLPAVEQSIAGLNEIATGQNGQVNANKRNIETLVQNLSDLVDGMNESISTKELSFSTFLGGTNAGFTGYVTVGGELEAGSVETEEVTAGTVNAVDVTASGKVDAQEVRADVVTVQELNAESMNLESISSGESYAERLTAANAMIESMVAGWVSSGGIASRRYTWRNTDEWKSITGTASDSKLLKISVPFYEGVVNILTHDGEFNVTIVNGALVSFNQHSLYLYRVDVATENITIYVDIGTRSLSYAWITIGENKALAVTSEMVDRVTVQQNIRAMSGTLGQIVQLNEDLSVVVTDALPSEGINNTIYIVSGDRSYFFNGVFNPMSMSIDIKSGHVTEGSLDENLIFPAIQYSIDSEFEAFPGTFYDASIIESEQIPTGTKLLYVDENNMIKFSPEYLLSGTKFGKKETVEANKATFDNIQWLKTGYKFSYNIPELNSTTWDIQDNAAAFYYVDFDGDPIGVAIDFTINGEKVTGVVQSGLFGDNIGFEKVLKGTVGQDGNITPDENGDTLLFEVVYNEVGKQLFAYLFSTKKISETESLGTIYTNTISGNISKYSETVSIPLADFVYKTEALTITNESGKSFSVGSQKVQSYVDYKQNAINAILDERSAYNNLMVSQIETILSEDVDFDKIIN